MWKRAMNIFGLFLVYLLLNQIKPEVNIEEITQGLQNLSVRGEGFVLKYSDSIYEIFQYSFWLCF